MKKVLITGSGSYIGESFRRYVTVHYPNELSVNCIGLKDKSWRTVDFSCYDIIFHVAGLAHDGIRNDDENLKKQYYAINTDLAIETAKKAKDSGVRQFVFMSSVIVYGNSAPYGKEKIITRDTEPSPDSFYGDSKLQAEKGLNRIRDDDFQVVIIRSPMVYGKGCKGNYSSLSSIAKRFPFFPDCYNERSMLYIDNLCEFIAQIMMREECGLFWPQNAEYSKTSEMVKQIAKVNGHRIFVTHLLNWAVLLFSRIPGPISIFTNKAFGNLTYDQRLSKYDFKYQLISLNESIKKTEEV